MNDNTRKTLDDIDKAGKNLIGCGCLIFILAGLLVVLRVIIGL